jgi:hypothetical protein
MKLTVAQHLLNRLNSLVTEAYGLQGISGTADRFIIYADMLVDQSLQGIEEADVAAARQRLEDLLDEINSFGQPPVNFPEGLWNAIHEKTIACHKRLVSLC